MKSLLDLRFVIGTFFAIIGCMLMVYGFASAELAAKTINSWCGGGFFIFGTLMILLSLKRQRNENVSE